MFSRQKGTSYQILNEQELYNIANLKLSLRGREYPKIDERFDSTLTVAEHIFEEITELTSQVKKESAVNRRLKEFLYEYFAEFKDEIPEFPETFPLDHSGLARIMSFPPCQQEFISATMTSYKLKQGVLHNPAKDKRITQGVFHVCEGGPIVPADKLEVPKIAYIKMLKVAFNAPHDSLLIPYTDRLSQKTHSWVSLFLRPLVVPPVKGAKGFENEKRTEMHFFVPGTMISCMDFVENIFGNAGNPNLDKNDSALNPVHWTGHTGFAVLAPHLLGITKKDLSLPHISEATERQKKDGMCWEKEDELYNKGNAFKLFVRDHKGRVMTIIADNYFGYCKKEVKTQISYAANLLGNSEEEHAGGAIGRPSYDLGEQCNAFDFSPDHNYEEVLRLNADQMVIQEEGHGIDKDYPDVVYVPENSVFDLSDSSVSFSIGETLKKIYLKAFYNYVLPSGYVIRLETTFTSRRWTLRGILPQHTFCHKPCTVSGGGKSEISKSIADGFIEGKMFVSNRTEDFKKIQEILDHDYSNRFLDPSTVDNVNLLDKSKSLGAVVVMLTESPKFTPEHNEYIRSHQRSILEIVFVIKSLYREEWKGDWQSRITVDLVNGAEGNEIKYRQQPLPSNCLRIGFAQDKKTWRVFQLRKDFFPSQKLQMEDDISTSVVIPQQLLDSQLSNRPSYKFLRNCEARLFQRPDDAIYRGYDKQTELDFSLEGNFISNYQQLELSDIQSLTRDVVRLHQYTEPMRKHLEFFVSPENTKYKWCVSSSVTRLVPNPAPTPEKPLISTNNPRYLQRRPDLVDPTNTYLTYKVIQLHRKIKNGDPLFVPVDAVLSGRRNNPPETTKEGLFLPPLSVFAPIHYYEYPELMMEYITSMTGASPSIYAAGSEGALTKGPFNCLPGIIDLNNILIAMILCGYQGFVSSAAYCGPKYRVAHDISLLVPEIWSRMRPHEQDADFLIKNGYLEKCPDINTEREGKPFFCNGRRLGYRITNQFCIDFFTRMFTAPTHVFSEDMLKPELQSLETYAQSYYFINLTDEYVGKNYLYDKTVEVAIPPLKALIHIMVHREYNGLTLESPEFRALFTRDYVVNSDWYKARLDAKQKRDVDYYTHSLQYLRDYQNKHPNSLKETIEKRVVDVEAELVYRSSPEYRSDIVGCIGLDTSLPNERWF